MPAVRLRRWRLEDIDDVIVMADDEWFGPWSTMGDDPLGWIEGEVAEARGPTRAICLPGDDRAIGRVALRTPEFASDAVRCAAIRDDDQPAGELGYWLVPSARGKGIALAAVKTMLETVAPASGVRSVVLDIEDGNTASMRLADRLGAERRSPTRVKSDPRGTDRTLVVYVLAL
jgi:RimJ/RimL family protein N-acetyltransferase